ncbi:hypothetical protein [Mycobacterium sp. 3519A]|uniref:hypothetical protein n=1 Tax=Mycobacterium sp. 3519A TaxID=2057184 RepID=UPI0011599CF3|nr:hypothetical protein [Mycobacterium sp. 3519A]
MTTPVAVAPGRLPRTREHVTRTTAYEAMCACVVVAVKDAHGSELLARLVKRAVDAVAHFVHDLHLVISQLGLTSHFNPLL